MTTEYNKYMPEEYAKINAKLKPCPFCGGVAKMWEDIISQSVKIECGKCEIGTLWDCSENALVRKWNKRDEDVLKIFEKHVKKLTVDMGKVCGLAESCLDNLSCWIDLNDNAPSGEIKEALRIAKNLIRIASKYENECAVILAQDAKKKDKNNVNKMEIE